MHQIAIEAQRFQLSMSGKYQCAAGSLIAPARLDANEAVLDQINTSDAVARTDIVQLLKQRNRRELLSADRNGNSLRESNLHLLCLIGSALRRVGPLPCSLERCIGWIFEFSTFVAYV